MSDLESTAKAIRKVESDENYEYQQNAKVGSTYDRKVGAYGILQSRWEQLADAAGYSGAAWQSREVQDAIARQKLQRDYEELGDWTLAAVAFRYGTPVARKLKQQGVNDAAGVSHAGHKQIGTYLRALRKSSPQTDLSVVGRATGAPKAAPPARKQAERVVRNHLVAIRDQQRGRSVSDANGQEEQVNG
jgi:hypothetical protein